MNVFVEPILDPISLFIDAICGPVLSKDDRKAMSYCQTLGEVYSGFVDGEFVCCWGLIPPTFLSNQAYLWMWAPEPIRHQFIFIRHSQLQVEKMLDRYSSIIGHCRCEARSAQRWLEWLGASFGQPKDGLMPFVIRRGK